jgi:hypothetical protein
MGGCPVRPFRLLDCSWSENTDFRMAQQSYLSEFSAWLFKLSLRHVLSIGTLNEDSGSFADSFQLPFSRNG